MSETQHPRSIPWFKMAWAFTILAFIVGVLHYVLSNSKVHDSLGPIADGIIFAVGALIIITIIYNIRIFIHYMEKRSDRRRANKEYAAAKKRPATATPVQDTSSAQPSK